MLFPMLVAISLLLTIAMFSTKETMLGFPSFIFWELVGAYSYQQSTVTGDLYYIVFIACSIGMGVFCLMAMYGLHRSKKLQATGVEEDLADEPMLDEGGQAKDTEEIDSAISYRLAKVRAKSDARRKRWSYKG